MCDTKPENVTDKCCSICKVTKHTGDFIKNRNICKNCNNEKRRQKYNTDEVHRIKLIENARKFKHDKVIHRAIERQKLQDNIGENNSICKYCNIIQSKFNFRHNRLKCKSCERDEPIDKFKRVVRCRIYISIAKKEKHTIEYLGCNYDEYIKWVSYNSLHFTLENHGKIWHIDHVIPLSKFNLENEEQQMIAFNWRNTMPLTVKENLSKNNKILPLQIEQHLSKLTEYHTTHNVYLPQLYIDLFARYLVAGSPLEPLLPPLSRNRLGELG